MRDFQGNAERREPQIKQRPK